ncbi:hypothetical protein [Streptomyces sp. NPDC058279]
MIRIRIPRLAALVADTVVFYDMRQLPNLIAERQTALHQALPTHKF